MDALLVFMVVAAATIVLVWDRTGPVGWALKRLFGPERLASMDVLNCYLCASVWIALAAIGPACALLGWRPAILGAAAAPVFFWSMLPQEKRYPQSGDELPTGR